MTQIIEDQGDAVFYDGKIQAMKAEIKSLQRKKGRADRGKTRAPYQSHLPPKLRSYISRANKKGWPFTLTLEQFNTLLSRPCVYCGDTNRPTIDRINSEDGYTPENSQPCCYFCNTIKNKYTPSQFLAHIRRIYDHIIRK